MEVFPNSVCLSGKVSRVEPIKYTPAGKAVLEIVVAADQHHLDRKSVGYFSVSATGDLAESVRGRFRVGSRISVEGSLWSRQFRDRKGNRVSETKVIARSIRGENDGRRES